jgi:hypothetical protein
VLCCAGVPPQVNNDVTLSTSTNIATKATKAGITYNTKVGALPGCACVVGAHGGIFWWGGFSRVQN